MNRIEMNIYDEKASENLIEFKKKDEHNMNKNTIISIVYAVTLVIDYILLYFVCMDSFIPNDFAGQKGHFCFIGFCQCFYHTVYVHIEYFAKSQGSISDWNGDVGDCTYFSMGYFCSASSVEK